MGNRKAPTPAPVSSTKPPPPPAPPASQDFGVKIREDGPKPTGQSAPDHEGTDPPILISEDQLSVYIANTAHLVLHKLRKEMHAEINKQVARLRIDHEKRWEQTLAQVKGLVRMDDVTPEEIAR